MPRFLAKAELWRIPVVRSVMAGGRHIPVQRASTRAADAYKEAIEALRRGEVVVFYPEGTFTADPDGWPMKAKNGIGRIALVTGAPVIPVANWGTQNLMPADRRPRLFPRKTVQVVAGPPVDLSRWLGGPRTRTALDAATVRDHVRHHGAGGRAARGGPAAGAVRPCQACAAVRRATGRGGGLETRRAQSRRPSRAFSTTSGSAGWIQYCPRATSWRGDRTTSPGSAAGSRSRPPGR